MHTLSLVFSSFYTRYSTSVGILVLHVTKDFFFSSQFPRLFGNILFVNLLLHKLKSFVIKSNVAHTKILLLYILIIIHTHTEFSLMAALFSEKILFFFQAVLIYYTQQKRKKNYKIL